MSARVLYLSYDGLTDPLGQSQVLPYLKRLAALGHRITVMSCDKPDALAVRGAAVAAECVAAGIAWHALRYRKSPPVVSTLADLGTMARAATRLHVREPFDIVHCRSYLAALVGRRLQRRSGIPFVFDMRGFWIDERFERGIWSSASPIYRVIARWFRRRERELFEHADAIVSLTRAARAELSRRGGARWEAKTEVVPCCVDLALFDPAGGAARLAGRAKIGLSAEVPVLLYLGSLGGAYPLEPLFDFFRAWSASRPNARLLFVTRHRPDAILEHPAARGLGDRIIVRAAERAEIPALVAAADAGTSFILPSTCAVASSPTKVGEMLAMGLPVVANKGVGDIALVLAEPGSGVLAEDLATISVTAVAAQLATNGDPDGPRAVARQWYSLDKGVTTYDALYRRLTSPAKGSREGKDAS